MFQIVFPASKPVVSVISDILAKEKQKGSIDGFYVLENKGRNKNGLPKSKDVTKKIYLYDSELNVQEYMGYNELEMQINSLRSSCLAFYIYIKYKDHNINSSDILKKIANNLGKELKDVYYELFPSNKKSDETK